MQNIDGSNGLWYCIITYQGQEDPFFGSCKMLKIYFKCLDNVNKIAICNKQYAS